MHRSGGPQPLALLLGRLALLVAGALCAGGLVAGCRATPGDSAGKPPAAADAPWTTAPLRHARSDTPRVATLRATRAREAGEAQDRAVFTFAGDSLPGYRVAYTEPPVQQCGSGRAVPVRGARFLEVRFRRARAHTDAGEPTIADRSRTPGLSVLKGLVLTCDFEGTVTWVLGLPAGDSASYRVRRRSSPARLTVEVRR